MRYGQGISSTVLVADNEEDAHQLPEVPDVTQLPVKQQSQRHSQEELPVAAAPPLKSTSLSSSGPDISAWRTLASQQLLPPSMSEFGAGQSHHTSHQPSTTNKGRRGSEKRLIHSSSNFGALSMKSPKHSAAATEVSPIVSQPPSYGYTTIGWDSQMDVTRAIEIVLSCGEQIRARGKSRSAGM